MIALPSSFPLSGSYHCVCSPLTCCWSVTWLAQPRASPGDTGARPVLSRLKQYFEGSHLEGMLKLSVSIQLLGLSLETRGFWEHLDVRLMLKSLSVKKMGSNLGRAYKLAKLRKLDWAPTFTVGTLKFDADPFSCTLFSS